MVPVLRFHDDIRSEVVALLGPKFTLTKGVFDLLHVGHLDSFEAAKELGLPLVVGVFDDASVRERKGPTRPINSESARARLVASLRQVDAVIIFHGRNAFEVICHLTPTNYVVTHLNQFSKGEASTVQRTTNVVFLNKDAGVSSTSLAHRLRQDSVDDTHLSTYNKGT